MKAEDEFCRCFRNLLSSLDEAGFKQFAYTLKLTSTSEPFFITNCIIPAHSKRNAFIIDDSSLFSVHFSAFIQKGFIAKSPPEKNFDRLKKAAEAFYTHISGHTYPDTQNHYRLTKREAEVLSVIAQGKNRRQAGLFLKVKEDTIKAHLESSRRKLNADNTVHAIAIALKKNIIRI